MKVSPEILNMIPYKPGKPISETQREFGISKVYKLASNENSLGVSPKALHAMQKAMPDLFRYPDPTCYDLLQAVGKKWGFSSTQLCAGNGSDELIELLVRIYCEPHEGVLTSQGAFAAYHVSAQASRVKTHFTPLRKDFGFDLPGMAEYFLHHPEHKIRLIFIANPNNPTGTMATAQEIEVFMHKVGNREDVLVVFDEAYTEFVRSPDYKDAFHFFNKYKNVVVLRTFSKIYGLAGIRLGIMVAPTETIEVVNRVRKPFNVNHLAQVAVIAALEDSEFVKQSQELVWSGLDYFYHKLNKLTLPYIPSQGNFVLFDTLRDASQVFNALLRRGIIMRPVGNYGFPHHLRLSVGLPEENEAAMKALTEVLKEVPQL